MMNEHPASFYAAILATTVGALFAVAAVLSIAAQVTA